MPGRESTLQREVRHQVSVNRADGTLRLLHLAGAAAVALATAASRMVARSNIFKIERENMRSPFGEPVFGSKGSRMERLRSDCSNPVWRLIRNS